MLHGFRYLAAFTLVAFLLVACGEPVAAPPTAPASTPAEEEMAPTEEEEATAPADEEEEATTPADEEETTTTEEETGDAEMGELAADLEGRVLTVGSDTTYPPMEFIDDQTREIVGFDVDMMNEIGRRINAEVEFETFPNFDAIFAALANGDFDLVVSSVSVTEERRQIIDFSDPYLSIGQVIAVQQENDTITTVEDLVNAELVGVQGGTTGEQAALEAGVDEAKIRRYDTIDLAFQDLANGAVDAVVADGPPSARYTAQLSDTVKVVGEPFTTEDYAIALQQDQPELKEAVNAALAQMKEDGTLEQLMEKWNLQDVATLP